MDVVLSTGTSSCGHTFGNIIEAVKMDILSKFSQGYFRYVHVSSQLAFRELKKFRDNAFIEFRKQEKPKIYIKPVYEFDEDGPFTDTLLTTHMMSGNGAMSAQSLMPIFRDSDRHVELDFRMNRDRISFEVTIAVSTLIQQLDLYNNLRNMTAFKKPHMKRFSLESMIPKQMIHYLAQNANLNIDDKPGSVATIVDYLHRHGSYPITYKIRNSSAQDEYFMYYEVSTMLTYSELRRDEGSKKNMTDDSYEISFTVSGEFNHPGAYVIRSVNGYPRMVPTDIRIEDTTTDIIPLFTMERIYETRESVANGFKHYFVSSFRTEPDLKRKPDSISLSEIIEDSYQRVIKKYVFSHIPPDILMRVLVFKDNIQMNSSEYSVDWNLMTLTILESDPTVTYRVILYANIGKFNEEFQEIMDATKRDKSLDALTPKQVHTSSVDRAGNFIREAAGEYYMVKDNSSPDTEYNP